MHIGIFYFSATGITERISKHISAILEKEAHTIHLKNILTHESRQSTIDFSEYDFIFFGFPVFGGRAPKIAEDWISTLDGKNQKCSMFFTYGARDLEWAHQSTIYLLHQSNFRVILSAEFIGRHSYNVTGWTLAEDRPNQADYDVATTFAQQSLSRFEENLEFVIDLSGFTYQPRKETKESTGEWAKFYPSRHQEDCSMCYLCEKECPVKAFDANSGASNRQICIRCMHCVTICPDRVIKTGDTMPVFQRYFIDHLGLTPEVVEDKTSKIYSSYPI